MTQRVGIINYNIGNIGSVKRSLDFFDTNYLMVNNAKDLKKCDKIFIFMKFHAYEKMVFL